MRAAIRLVFIVLPLPPVGRFSTNSLGAHLEGRTVCAVRSERRDSSFLAEAKYVSEITFECSGVIVNSRQCGRWDFLATSERAL